MNLKENDIDNKTIELFLNEFNEKYITGAMLKEFKNNKLIDEFKSQFSSKNQMFGIWMIIKSIINTIETNETIVKYHE